VKEFAIEAVVLTIAAAYYLLIADRRPSLLRSS